jgi:mono/diheme cytochrome c family protein
VRFIPLTAVLAGLSPTSGVADDVIETGRALVEANCASCHAVGNDDASLHRNAPAFRDLDERFPIDALEETFVGTIDTGHPGMPVFVARQDQIDAIIAYIASIMR